MSYLAHDTVEMEKAGVPTVCLAAKDFTRAMRLAAEAYGISGLPIATVPSIMMERSSDEVRGYVELVFEDVVRALTTPVAKLLEEAGPAALVLPENETLDFAGADMLKAIDAMNRAYLEKGWSDGFPLVPPTQEAVEEMMGGTRRDVKKTVALLEPSFGIASIEKIAINAVMAGCRPEHMPVLIATVEAMADPMFHTRGVFMSTGNYTPMLLINGPLARELKVNAGRCCFGPGSPSYANTVMGRAIRLIIMNIAHVYPGINDLDSFGSSEKYSMCIAENEAESPWAPFHVTRGYDKDASTVTVFSPSEYVAVSMGGTDPKHIMEKISISAAGCAVVTANKVFIEPRILKGGTGPSLEDPNIYGADCLVLLGPSHARILASNGWLRPGIQEFFFQHARGPFFQYEKGDPPDRLRPEWRWVAKATDAVVPIVTSPERVQIAVAGEESRKSMWFGCEGRAITRLIDG